MKRISAILFILFIALNINIKAQSDNVILEGYSINPKYGMYNIFGKENGFVGGAEINIVRNKIIYSADLYSLKEFVIFGDPSEDYYQFGLMIGAYKGEVLRSQFQLGLSSLWGSKKTVLLPESFIGIKSPAVYNTDNFFTIGLETKIGLKIICTNWLSIGVDLQSNINFYDPLYFTMLSIEIGKLRNK